MKKHKQILMMIDSRVKHYKTQEKDKTNTPEYRQQMKHKAASLVYLGRTIRRTMT